MLVKRLFKAIIIAALIVLFPVAASTAEQKPPHIRIAFLPCSDLLMAYQKFYPLIAYLKNQTGFDIKLVVFKDVGDVKSALKNAEIDFILQDPQTYVHFSGFFRKDSLIGSLTKDGNSVQHGVFIARKSSGIMNLKSLRGKSVMFGPELSAAKWVAAKLLLEENGIRVNRDLKSYSHGGCCDDIGFNVSLGAVDSGVVCAHFLDEHPQKQKEIGIDPKKLVIIGRTKSVPTKVFCAHKKVPYDIVAKISQALLRLDRRNPEHSEILYPAELGGFKKARDADYNMVRISAEKL